MRFIAAIVSFVVAFVMVGYGIAQRTILAEPDHVAAAADIRTGAAVTLIDGSVLNAIDGRQKVEISGADSIFAAYGRTSDVLAWVGDTAYNEIGFDAETSTLTSTLVEGANASVPDPRGSDLWLAEYARDAQLTFIVNVPEDVSVIIVSDGTEPAPSQISVTWPVDNRTPWSGPLIVGGVLLLLLGLLLYLWALSHLRRARGPRRKPPKMPKPPKRLRYRPKQKAVTASRVKGRRSSSRGMIAVVPVLVGTLALGGCSAESWPEFLGGAPQATPTPTATEQARPRSDAKPPAVSVQQADSIISRVALVAQKADADRDKDLLASRFTGPALELRAANYAIRHVDNSVPPLAAIPAGPAKITVPQTADNWPRTVFAVIPNPDDDAVLPTAMMLVQDTPRDNYKVVYAMQLAPSAELPKFASASIGASRLSGEVKVLAMPPNAIAGAYGDILLTGPDSAFLESFDIENDALVKSIGFDAKAARKASIPSIASMEFANAVGASDPIAMASDDSGAVVAVYLTETETVKPVEPGAVINAEGAVKSLSGVSSSTKGTIATYGDQLLFYVPSAISGDKIVLIGWASGLIAAKEL